MDRSSLNFFRLMVRGFVCESEETPQGKKAQQVFTPVAPFFMA